LAARAAPPTKYKLSPRPAARNTRKTPENRPFRSFSDRPFAAIGEFGKAKRAEWQN